MGDKKKQEDPHPADLQPCPVCGGREFTWGKPIAYGALVFKGDNTGYFGQRKLLLMRECNNCGNVLWFTKRKKK
jgi:hypothetical protein